jgi:hypothetical protein
MHVKTQINTLSNNDVKKMKTTTEDEFQTTVVANVAGEDIKPGDFVTVASEIIELPSYMWSCSGMVLPLDEPVRARYMTSEAGHPFKVFAVCLPFVYAKRPCDKLVTFDTRRQQLVRLDAESGRKVWKHLRSDLKPIQ